MPGSEFPSSEQRDPTDLPSLADAGGAIVLHWSMPWLDDEREHPGLFDLWPQIAYINCPQCKVHWPSPHLHSENPPAYCPQCGACLPELATLLELGLADGSPVENKPFIGTVSGIQAFLRDAQGAKTQLWKYVVSHSYLVLKMNSLHDDTHAFMVCLLAESVELPQLHWRASLALTPTSDKEVWELRDEAMGARIRCRGIGIFHQVTRLW